MKINPTGVEPSSNFRKVALLQWLLEFTPLGWNLDWWKNRTAEKRGLALVPEGGISEKNWWS